MSVSNERHAAVLSTNKANLSYVFEPPSQRYEHKQHRGRFEKRLRTTVGLLRHGNDYQDDRIDVGDNRRHDDKHVHVCAAVFYRDPRLNVEVTTAVNLQTRKVILIWTNFFLRR